MKRRLELSAFDLKLIAVVTMFLDHLGYTLLPGALWLRGVGRLAFPIFAFQIAEGAGRTRDFGKYLGRLALFAVVAEVPFNLMCRRGLTYPYGQNVLWTLLIALAAIGCIRWAERKDRPALLAAVWIAAAAGGWLLGEYAYTDYGGWGVATVLVFYLCREKKWGLPVEIAAMLAIHGYALGSARVMLWGVLFPIQALAVLALLPIHLYRGRQGPHNRGLQIAFYAFYPVHILILALIAMYLQ